MKILKKIITFIWITILLVLFGLNTISVLDTPSLIYWWLAFGWTFVVWAFNLKDILTLNISFVLFMISVFVFTIGFENAGEAGMRVGFTLLIIGFMQSLVKYVKSKK